MSYFEAERQIHTSVAHLKAKEGGYELRAESQPETSEHVYKKISRITHT